MCLLLMKKKKKTPLHASISDRLGRHDNQLNCYLLLAGDVELWLLVTQKHGKVYNFSWTDVSFQTNVGQQLQFISTVVGADIRE